MRRSPSFTATVTCSCGRVELKRSAMQRFCMGCSAARDNARKTTWRKTKKPSRSAAEIQHDKDRRSKKEQAAFDRGAAISHDARRSLMWVAESEPTLNRIIRFAVPFSWSFSKNAIFTLAAGTHHVALRKTAKNLKNSVALYSKLALQGTPMFQGKVWIDILVQKPSHRGDAVNVVDLICDGIKEGIAVDDRWFSIRRLDWEIVKTKPLIYIGIGQEIVCDHKACSYCGQARPLAQFYGRTRMCLACHGTGIEPDEELEHLDV